MKGRQILDGVLIANEVVEEARLIMFKVNFEKAYDSVDISYLDSTLKWMNLRKVNHNLSLC